MELIPIYFRNKKWTLIKWRWMPTAAANVEKQGFDGECKGDRAGHSLLFVMTTKPSDYQSDLSSGSFFLR